jgi:D-alanine-D-alanine ligase
MVQVISKNKIEQLGRVAVLMGGQSPERDISLRSGQAVLGALLALGINAHALDPVDHSLEGFILTIKAFDRVFIVLHGEEGENGKLQALLDLMGIPYTGSGVSASAIGMNKMLTKSIWRANLVPTPFAELISSDITDNNLRALVSALKFPFIAKPYESGSSLGVYKIHTFGECQSALDELFRDHKSVMLEAFIEGREFAVGMLGNQILPPVEIVAPNGFYDYHAKYQSDKTQYFCPASLSTQQNQELLRLSKMAFESLGCKGWGRVDVMMSKTGEFWFLEINTVPGMTATSLVPKEARQMGISFEDLVLKILELTLPI